MNTPRLVRVTLPAQSRTRRRSDLIIVVLANLIPLHQVVNGAWSLSEVIALFWLENLIIGIVHFSKLLLCNPAKRPRSKDDKLAIEFFPIFYGGFTLLQGVALVLGYFFIGFDSGTLSQSDGFSSHAQLSVFWWALAAILFSHAISFVRRYLYGGGRRRETIDSLGMGPIRRVVILQVLLVGGGIIAAWYGEPIWALVVLVSVKLLVDLAACWRALD
ncbi:DUF6498-containing protein [Dokdonella sp.]|uniref:DUF6498-containing protein n=1 Tax=Dokdonella sp. TaxID=2291710 RepID=UPI003C582A41